jgi:hypothetical protein
MHEVVTVDSLSQLGTGSWAGTIRAEPLPALITPAAICAHGPGISPTRSARRRPGLAWPSVLLAGAGVEPFAAAGALARPGDNELAHLG